MIHPALQPVIRRAILDLIFDVGGAVDDDTATILLNEIGHRIARSDVAAEIRWLADKGLVRLTETPAMLVIASTSDGRDTAMGRLRFEGVSRHKTGE